MAKLVYWFVMLRDTFTRDFAKLLSEDRISNDKLRCFCLQVLEAFCKVVNFRVDHAFSSTVSLRAGDVSWERHNFVRRVNQTFDIEDDVVARFY